MSSEFLSTLFKAVGPLLGIGVLLLAARRGRLQWGDDLGIRRPPALRTALWLLLWLICIALTEFIRARMGVADPPMWPAYAAPFLVMRILGIGVFGPVLEEMLFRGVLYGKLSRTRLRPLGAIVLVAAGWTVIHTPHDAHELGFIFFDGLLLGTARWHTRSVFVPCIMHVIGNLFSVGQSLGII